MDYEDVQGRRGGLEGEGVKKDKNERFFADFDDFAAAVQGDKLLTLQQCSLACCAPFDTIYKSLYADLSLSKKNVRWVS